MVINYNETIGVPVLVKDDGKEVGKFRKFIINFENGRILGLLLSAGVLEKSPVIKIEDVMSFGKDAIMIKNDEVIKPLKAIGIWKDLLAKKVKIKGNQVVTESGDKLGMVKNFEVDDVSYKLVRFYVSQGFLRDLFKGELIIPFDDIVSIGKDAIIVRDNVVKEKRDEAIVSKVETKEAATDVAMLKKERIK